MRPNLMETRRVRRSRRRGAALVIVMIFAVGAIMLVTTMLTLTNQSVKTVGEMHAQKNLNLVLKTGLASALNEVTQNTDPGNDGVGALTGGSGSPGVAVTSPTGIVLGRYRVTVDRTTYSGRRVLTAVAAFPDFTSPTRLVAAEVEIATGRLTGAANPLSFAGEVDDEDKFTGPSNANKLNITAPDGDVAAVNVEDDDLYDEFNADIVPNATVSGADPSDPGSMATGSGTVTNESAGVLNETTLSSVRSNIVTKASEVKNSLLKTTLSTSLGSQSLGSGTFYVPGNLDISGTVSGSGTLVVEGSKLTVKNGAKLDWNGTIIVIGDVESPNTQNAEVVFENGGKVDMDHTGSQSFLFIVGQDTKLTAEPGAGSARDITGGLLLLSGPNEDAKLEFKSGGGSDGLVINGITALYGSKLSATMDNGFNASLTGSLAFVTQAAGSGRYTELTKANGGTVNLTFNSTVFNDSLEALGDYITDTSAFPPAAGSYWERNAQAVLATQSTRLSSGTKWGIND